MPSGMPCQSTVCTVSAVYKLDESAIICLYSIEKKTNMLYSIQTCSFGLNFLRIFFFYSLGYKQKVTYFYKINVDSICDR